MNKMGCGNCSSSRAVCEWSKAGAKRKHEVRRRFAATVYSKDLAVFLRWLDEFTVGLKTVTKPQAAATQQASHTRAAVGFKALAQRYGCMCFKDKNSCRDED